MSAKRFFIAAALAASVAAGYFALRLPGGGGGGTAPEGDGETLSHAEAPRRRLPRVPTHHRRIRARPEVEDEWTLDDFDDEEHPYSRDDKRTALELQLAQDALDELEADEGSWAGGDGPRGERREDPAARRARERFAAAAAKAAASPNPALRREAVEAYSWHGGEWLPELTPLMADADGEVAAEALDAVETALEEVESPALRFEVAAAYIEALESNAEALELLSGVMVSSALEMIEPGDDAAASEQQARENRNLVVGTLATLIEGGKGADAAKEAYADITSEDWISRAEAEKWALDPDEPPDDGEEGSFPEADFPVAPAQ